MLHDNYGRKIDYVRLSVTDKCNLRCRYCMPENGVVLKKHDQILRWEEMYRMIKLLTWYGVNKVRITGGEPLIRKGLLQFVESLSDFNLKDISITTNGMLLKTMARDLKEVGISRVNVSLDSLNRERYAWITRGGELNRVLEGIHAALEVGLEPVKVNAVVVRGFNDDEVLDLAKLSLELPIHVRFIELMPVGCGNIWGENSFVSTDETKERISKLGELQPTGIKGNGPAKMYQLKGGQGTIGFISAISEHFCATCNRIRLTADGRIYPCLHSMNFENCFELLRNGMPDEILQETVQRVINMKPAQHNLGIQRRMMNTIGG